MGSSSSAVHKKEKDSVIEKNKNVESSKDTKKDADPVSRKSGTNEIETSDYKRSDSKKVKNGDNDTRNEQESHIKSKESVLQSDVPENQTSNIAELTGDNCRISLPSNQTIETDDTENKEKEKENKKRKFKENYEKLKIKLMTGLKNLKSKNEGSEILHRAVVKALDKASRLYPTDYKEEIMASYAKQQATLELVRREKTKLLHRLSELASSRLRHNNPDIADLSDENRATKLAEKLSELYDNEWTDLFEATKHCKTKCIDEDRCIAEGLRDILQYCCKECQRVAEDQRVHLLRNLKTNTPEVFTNSPQRLQMLIKEFQKNLPQYTLPKIKKDITDSAQKSLKENIVIKCSNKTKKQFDPFINLCIEISWYTQIQDPPLHLVFHSDDADVSNFRPYTTSGSQLDYVLWPVLLLHDNGSVVAKGVAQFKAESETKSESAQAKKTENAQKETTNEKCTKTADSVW
ncbi:uncharacterized protein LOC132744325 [Ruditapes philippinarum]|uniref:uncharacterized protein LOC132744325 n=1 Tax=Ruditapes philippinarum TaxID=129788 RepID=UPI00295C2DC8|nr:uncharacterized protein LOC132744325 [Ruditapes philippinarum]